MAASLMLLTVVGLFGAVVLLIFGLCTKSFFLVKAIAGAVGIWLLIYFGMLLFNSCRSQERVLAFEQPKEFCGFYLDCHLHLQVDQVMKTKTLSGTGGSQTAEGMFYLVTVKVFNNARRAKLGLLEPSAYITDQRGRVFLRRPEAELLVSAGAPPLNQKLAGGDSFTRQLVFDVPSDAQEPVLQVDDGYRIDRWLELFLVGDDDSLFHKKVKFRLEPATGS
jgi:hypothetical protein